MRQFFAFFLIISSISFAQSNEPVKFRGAYIGEPLSDFVDCSSGKAKNLKDGYKTHGKVCEGGKGVVERLHVRGFLNTNDVLCEKLRALFFPAMQYADFAKQFLIEAKDFKSTVLPDLYLKRLMRR